MIVLTRKLFEMKYNDSGITHYIVADTIIEALDIAEEYKEEIQFGMYNQHVTSIKECDFDVKLLSNEATETIL